jgi:hypothetical protein
MPDKEYADSSSSCGYGLIRKECMKKAKARVLPHTVINSYLQTKVFNTDVGFRHLIGYCWFKLKTCFV